MPKAQKLRKFSTGSYSTPYTKAVPTVPSDAEPINAAKLSRGQRKRKEKKQRQIALREKLQVQQLELQRQAESQGGFHLVSLEDSLPSTGEIGNNEKINAPRRMKGKVAIREVERMKLVMQHPAFQQDPLAALKYHLEHVVKPSSRS
jgi:hypothetical protein